MRRALVSIAAGMLSLLLLSGCVGIPTSGQVETGPTISVQPDSPLVYLPSDPTPGAEPEEILRDFLRAMQGPQGDYAVARKFLTPALATAWKPNEQTIITQGAATTTPGVDENTLNYTITSRALVDADWRYSETSLASTTLEFAFTQESGEWRISAAPDGIVLTETSFNSVFTERALYFFDPSYTYLVPDVRWFPSRATLGVRIGSALANGPTPSLASGVLTAFPESTSVVSVTVRSGVATVELGEAALNSTPEERVRMRQQLAATLDVPTVIMTVEGLELVVPDTGVGPTRNPRVDPAALVGVDGRFGFDSNNGVASIPDLSDKVAGAGATAATLSADHESAAFLAPEGVYVARTNEAAPRLLDSRAGLVAPALDPFGYVWSAQASSAATLVAYEYDGTEHELQSGLAADATIVSIDVSRDGTRLLVSLLTSSGPRLYVMSITRDQRLAPTGLGEDFQTLASPVGVPLDSTWLDDRRVASLIKGDNGQFVTLIEIGGKSSDIGDVPTGVSIAGGNGREGLRVLDSAGSVWRLQGSNWVETGTVASFLGTKQ